MIAPSVAKICCVVEGHGGVQAIPVLVRRIASELLETMVIVPTPHRLPRGKMLIPGELGRATRLQASRAGELGGVLVLTDADDDEVADLSRRLEAGIDRHVVPRSAVVIAVREYEAWFLAAVPSLRSHQGVLDDADFHGDPESPRDAKKRMEKIMLETYKPTIHQRAFSKLIDLDAARDSSASFAALVDAVTTLLRRG